MRRDNQLIVLTHLSQLATFLLSFGSFIIPLILWVVNKDKVYGMDQHGKNILNFQISMFIYMIMCIPLIFLLGLGIVGLVVLGLISIIFPIINAIKANNGEVPEYPFAITIIK